jgi:hypothetical protein
MKVTTKVLEVIQQYRSDAEFTTSGDTTSPRVIMYTYGATDDFRNMILDLEETFKVELDIDDIGEMTVQNFIDLVIKKVQKVGLNTVIDVIQKGYNAILQKGETFHIVGGVSKHLLLKHMKTGKQGSINMDDVELYITIRNP